MVLPIQLPFQFQLQSQLRRFGNHWLSTATVTTATVATDGSRLQELRNRLVVDPPFPLPRISPRVTATSTTTDTTTTKRDTTKTDATSTAQRLHPPQPSLDSILTHLRTLPSPLSILTDSHQRHHSYLRLSLSERCNLRCQYCMPPEGVPLQPDQLLLTRQELFQLTQLFVRHGITKIRLTGGEPLLRPDLVDIVKDIRTLVDHVGMTTNGITLTRHWEALVDAGLTHVNISLDTLQASTFQTLTRRPGLSHVLRAMELAATTFSNTTADSTSASTSASTSGSTLTTSTTPSDSTYSTLTTDSTYSTVTTDSTSTTDSTTNIPSTAFGRVKINCVVMKGINVHELKDFCLLTRQLPIDVRFIEWMPFFNNGWNQNRFVSYATMLESLESLELQRSPDGPNDTTKWWNLPDSSSNGPAMGRIGFITSMSEHFCGNCNRLRLTADGQLKVCLFGRTEVNLRDVLRGGENNTNNNNHSVDDDLERLIHYAVQRKHAVLGGHDTVQGIVEANDNRPMTLIGG
jgi:GTP 3',8-cyclase